LKPSPGDYNPYYNTYISELLNEDDIVKFLNKQKEETISFLGSIPADKAAYSYAPGKWTIKEVVGHIIDTERIMAYRALCIARNEKIPLPGFEQDDYVNEAGFKNRKFDNLIDEFKKVREANLLLFNSFSDDMLRRRGVASNSEVTVLALLYIIAGHARHHVKILRDKYLSK
jgi:DinB superfamily